MVEIKGKIVKITYFNHENGYGVVKVELEPKEVEKLDIGLFSNELTVVSTFTKIPFIDEMFTFAGDIVNSKYGIQLKASIVRHMDEQTEAGIIMYLSSDLFPGIGMASAKKVYDALGDKALKMIGENPNCLDKVNIKEKQKETIIATIQKFENEEKELVELLSYGLTLKLAMKLMNTLEGKALEIVKENPYDLIYRVEGIGFLRADDIAFKVGIKKDSDLRLKALIVYVLNTLVYESGNTYMHLNDLFLECINFLRNEHEEVNPYNKDNFVTFINELVEEKRIIVDENHYVYEVRSYLEECSIARRVKSYLTYDGKLEYNLDRLDYVIDEVQRMNNIVYTDEQINAITKAIAEPITIITGGPGTGKSTVIRGIIEAYSRMFKAGKESLILDQIVLCAPTGRASKRLKEVCLHDAMTIHKLLGYNGRYFTVEDVNCKMIIIDEFSMVDVHLAYHLFKAIKPGTKVVIVGDVNQLPAVGAGDVLNDLILSKEVTTIKLNKIHRQASDSSIISLAHSINDGIVPDDIYDNFEDRRFLKANDEYIIPLIIDNVHKYINQGLNIIEDIQILVPMYNVSVGINVINRTLQDEFNPLNKNLPSTSESKEIRYGSRRFRLRDKVIQLINRADKGVMNGDIGYISELDYDINTNSYKGLKVKFDFGIVEYKIDELEDLNLAYAISIHKAQGSEFKVAIVPFSFKYYIMLKRKLIYTAITRAKQELVMLGNMEALRRGVCILEEKRRTLLKEKLQELINSSDEVKSIYDSVETNFGDLKLEEMTNVSPYDFMD